MFGGMNDPVTIIKELGGPTKVASALGVRPNVVGNWGARGIPYQRHDDLLDLARERGIDLTRAQLKAVAKFRGSKPRKKRRAA